MIKRKNCILSGSAILKKIRFSFFDFRFSFFDFVFPERPCRASAPRQLGPKWVPTSRTLSQRSNLSEKIFQVEIPTLIQYSAESITNNNGGMVRLKFCLYGISISNAQDVEELAKEIVEA